MFRTLILAGLTVSLAIPVALAGPPERLERIDNRTDRLERSGVISPGSPADLIEDRLDRIEDRVDRREDIRDRAVDLGPLDRIEDRRDTLENRRDRREIRRDREN